MKYLMLFFLFIGCSKNELKVEQCFEIRNQNGLFKVRVVNENSYFAGRIIHPEKMLKKYPANQISIVSKDDDVLLTDCMNSDDPKWLEMWETAIIREYEDRKSYYDKDAKLPKRYKK